LQSLIVDSNIYDEYFGISIINNNNITKRNSLNIEKFRIFSSNSLQITQNININNSLFNPQSYVTNNQCVNNVIDCDYNIKGLKRFSVDILPYAEIMYCFY
jgi:hypothetical protein